MCFLFVNGWIDPGPGLLHEVYLACLCFIPMCLDKIWLSLVEITPTVRHTFLCLTRWKENKIFDRVSECCTCLCLLFDWSQWDLWFVIWFDCESCLVGYLVGQVCRFEVMLCFSSLVSWVRWDFVMMMTKSHSFALILSFSSALESNWRLLSTEDSNVNKLKTAVYWR